LYLLFYWLYPDAHRMLLTGMITLSRLY